MKNLTPMHKKLSPNLKSKIKFILIVEDLNDKQRYYGPFDDGEKALEWGEKNFGEKHFLMSTTLYDPGEEISKNDHF